MHLGSLRVFHQAKTSSAAGARLPYDAFYLESCQRWIWVTNTSQNAPSEVEIFEGVDAYRFLLRIATGLESALAGETEIFGQLKEAWRKFEETTENTALLHDLSSWMQRLFEDVKEIRARFLQNMGGSSYGSLVRMILRNNSQQVQGPVLLVGAGQLAQSIAPWIVGSDLWLTNRSTEPLFELFESLVTRPSAQPEKIRTLHGHSEEMAGWESARHVVICVPIHSEKDLEKIQALQRNPHLKSVIHLGGSRAQAAAWSHLPGFVGLDDLFEMQKSRDNTRSFQLDQAGSACEERARLRALGASLSIPHGWEDLAAFA